LKDADGNDTPEAAYYLGANRNKRSVTCDIAQPAGQALIRNWRRSAMCLSKTSRSATWRVTADYASLKVINPRLVY
jgi:crotonobetainyl-CoA:carnitine CoA-transferase CaiB-like acyl-CoA transferase